MYRQYPEIALKPFYITALNFGPCRFLCMPAYSYNIPAAYSILSALFCALLTCLVFGTIHIFNNKSLSPLVDNLAFDFMQLKLP